MSLKSQALVRLSQISPLEPSVQIDGTPIDLPSHFRITLDDGPGAYGRKTPVIRSAEFPYNHVVPANGPLAGGGEWRQDVANNSGKEVGTWGISQTAGQVCYFSKDRSLVEESLFNSATTNSLMRPYSIKELLRAVRRVPATAPQSDKLSKGGHETHQDHWIGWLKEYDGPGYYGRSDWSVDARPLSSLVILAAEYG